LVTVGRLRDRDRLRVRRRRILADL
jgi:hypothetical protein